MMKRFIHHNLKVTLIEKSIDITMSWYINVQIASVSFRSKTFDFIQKFVIRLREGNTVKHYIVLIDIISLISKRHKGCRKDISAIVSIESYQAKNPEKKQQTGAVGNQKQKIKVWF